MFKSLDALHARVLLAIFSGLSLWGILSPPPHVKVAPPGAYNDMRLYKDILDRMRDGAGYHEAASFLQRQHGYPLHPFVTVRLPTLEELAYCTSWHYLWIMAVGLALLATLVWFCALVRPHDVLEAFLVPCVVVLANSTLVVPDMVTFVETMAGCLMAIAIGMRLLQPDNWLAVWIPAICALFIREHVLPLHLLSLLFALRYGRRREAALWAGGIAAFAAYLAWHAHALQPWLLVGDKHSPGWFTGGGLTMFSSSFVFSGALGNLPLSLAGALVFWPVLGWMSLEGEQGEFMTLLVYGYIAVFALFCRIDTFYWAVLILPWYTMGYVLAPRALWHLCRQSGLLGKPENA